MVRAGLVQWRDHDVGALLMLTKQKWNQMDGDGRWYCDAAELRQLSRSQGGHNGDPCPAWHHDTSRVEFRNFYICRYFRLSHFVKLRQGSGKDGQGMAVKAIGLKA